ncbi:MAG: cytochrome c oxidase assembly protein [Chloroflexi bacterium]|nr:MAG: cytochrome c oxidase assembly protein [Chloroflexota bacterium]
MMIRMVCFSIQLLFQLDESIWQHYIKHSICSLFASCTALDYTRVDREMLIISFIFSWSFFMLNVLNFSWHWSPITLIGLVILCLLYAGGIRFARRHNAHATLKGYRVLAFIAAILVLAIVLLTPLDTIARTQLFAAHMIQAIALTTLCAPLLLAACPDWLLQPLVDQPIIRRVLQVLTSPLLASIIFNLTFLIWHAPGLCAQEWHTLSHRNAQLPTCCITQLVASHRPITRTAPLKLPLANGLCLLRWAASRCLCLLAGVYRRGLLSILRDTPTVHTMGLLSSGRSDHCRSLLIDTRTG